MDDIIAAASAAMKLGYAITINVANSISIRRRLSIQKTGDPIFVLELALYFSVHVVLGNGNIKRKKYAKLK